MYKLCIARADEPLATEMWELTIFTMHGSATNMHVFTMKLNLQIFCCSCLQVRSTLANTNSRPETHMPDIIAQWQVSNQQQQQLPLPPPEAQQHLSLLMVVLCRVFNQHHCGCGRSL